MKTLKIILIGLSVLLVIGLINRAINGKQIDKRNLERDSLAVVESKNDSTNTIIENTNRKDVIKDIQTSGLVDEVIITEANVL